MSEQKSIGEQIAQALYLQDYIVDSFREPVAAIIDQELSKEKGFFLNKTLIAQRTSTLKGQMTHI